MSKQPNIIGAPLNGFNGSATGVFVCVKNNYATCVQYNVKFSQEYKNNNKFIII